MTEHDLLDAMEGIDTRYIEDAAVSPRRKRPIRLRVAAAAACVCLLACGVWQGTQWHTMHAAMTQGDAVALPQEAFVTSDTYGTLTDLLEGLRNGESHMRGDGVEIPVQTTEAAALTEGQNAVVYNGYSYHLSYDTIAVSDLTGTTPQAVGAIDLDTATVPLSDGQTARGNFTALFLHKDRLIAVYTIEIEETSPLDVTRYAAVTVYSLTDPAVPAALHRFVQLGSLTHVYTAGDRLTLMTADGVCSCGWSRLKNTENYVPQLTVDGEVVTWGEERIHILGNPRMVQYLAVAQVDMMTATVTDHRAFYGEVTDVYYGADWFALDTSEDVDAVYTFAAQGDIRYTGAITMPDPEFASTSVLSVSKDKDIYRVIAEYRTGRGGNTETSLLAMTANIETGESAYRLRLSEYARLWSLSEVVWEKDRAVIVTEGTVLFAEFHGAAVRLYDSPFEVQTFRNADGAVADKTLIDLTHGQYLRFTAKGDGLELWDLSKSYAPKKTFCETLLAEGETFVGCWTVYDRRTVGVVVAVPDENGTYRRGTVQWHIYRLDRKEKTFERLAVYDLPTASEYSSSVYQASSFAYEGRSYITAAALSAPLTISW